MKSIAIKHIFFSLIILLSISCKKELNLEPINTIIENVSYENIDDIEKGVIGCYAFTGITNRIYIGSLISDEVRLSFENRGQGQDTYKLQYSANSDDPTGGYSASYTSLDAINRLFVYALQITTKTPDEEKRRQKALATLYALRGVAYYELLIRFSPSNYDLGALCVPITLAVNVNEPVARNTVGQVIGQIESDFAAAKNIGANGVLQSSALDATKISIGAIAAFQARVALLKKDWNSVVTYTTEAITVSGRSVSDRASYSDIWADVSDNEIIWKFRNTSRPQLLWRDANGDVFFEPSMKLKYQFYKDSSSDIRYTTFFGPTADDTSTVKKYPGSSQFGPQVNDLKLIRVSEMVLTRAEAYAELNQLASATNDLNSIRSNRISGYVNVVPFVTKDEAIDNILNERYKELCFEGFRFFDLKRRQLPIERLDIDVQSAVWKTLPASSFRWALPIPFSELLANPLAVQNAGY